MRIMSLGVLLLTAAILALSGESRAGEVLIVIDPGHGGTDRGGYNKSYGFSIDGKRYPEDAYTFDTAKRLERLAQKNGWKTFLTVVPDSPYEIQDSMEENPLSPRKDLFYNFPDQHVRVYPGKDGLMFRLKASKRAVRDLPADAVVIYISLHFDWASPSASGTKIFTLASLARHPFVLALDRAFHSYGLGASFAGKTRCGIDYGPRTIVLCEGEIVPRVLVELGNINNRHDQRLILSPKGREVYAEIISRAISQYLNGLKGGPVAKKSK